MTASPERSAMSTVKLALLANQVRAQLADGDALAAEPIAIIGMGCRVPGGAHSPEAFWQIIRDGVDAISEVPADRWDVDEFFAADAFTAGRMNTRWGGFVDGIDQFDAAYFGISPREAAHMDPQQRLVLEVAIEALERAGQTNAQLAGSRTGVFVASSMHDFADREHAGVMDIDAYSVTGGAEFIIPNRLSFLLDLRGPSVSVDTACSSSLVAIHLACQSLRSRDSDMALAGGVNVLLSPSHTVGLSQWGLMAPDGRCKTFDARADGFVRSEGCGILVLKRLADAISDNDPVVAVIRGSAVNQDGKSTAMSAPNGLAQQDVIRRALSSGQVLPGQVSCVEAHGTGTVLGDPIEVEAIAAALDAPEPGSQPVALTAVKTNVGHLEAAAGVVGLIKVVLCLQHEEIPAPVHFQKVNPHISLDGTRLFIPTERHPWPAGPTRRIAGVSSFGFGGTNAHVVVEEAPRLPVAPPVDGLPLLVLSAHTPDALRDTASAMADHLDSQPAVSLADLQATAATRRTNHDERVAVVGSTVDDLVERLRAFGEGETQAMVVVGRRAPGARRRVAFVCSGQGNQWWGMARELLAASPEFRTVIEQCDELLRPHVAWSLLEELARPEPESRLERTEVAQPAIFAVQVGLAAVWRGWGITPDAIVGHSIGEIAAAHLSGALDLADAVRVVALRAESMRDTFGTGAMASVELPAPTVASVVESFGRRLSIAALNAPDVTVISGEPAAVVDAVALLQADGAVVKALPVTYPFHSAQMEPCAVALEASLAGLAPSASHTRFVSSVTGEVADGTTLDAAYWARNVVAPVRFAAAIGALAELGCDTFIELGPHPVLGGAIVRTLDGASVSTSASRNAPLVVASLRRGRPDLDSLAVAVGQLHCAGVAIDWSAVWPGRHPVVALPTYRWQRQRHWVDTWQPVSSVAAGEEPTGRLGRRLPYGAHPLVGARVRSPAIDGFVFESTLSPDAPSFLADHRVGGLALMPGTGFIEAARAAFEAATSQVAGTLESLDIVAAMPVADDGGPTTMQVHIRGDVTAATFVVSSTVDGESWTEHARGRLSTTGGERRPVDLDAVRERCTRAVAGSDLYAGIATRGIDFGPSFRGVREVLVGEGEVLGSIVAPADVEACGATYGFHPALLDAVIHPVVALLPDDGIAVLPIALGALNIHRVPPHEMWSHVQLRSAASADILTVDISVVGSDGAPVADLIGLRLVRASAESVRAGAASRDAAGRDERELVYALEWNPAPSNDSHTPPGPWLVVDDAQGVGLELAEHLRRTGAQCTVVGPTDLLTRELVRQLVQADGVREVVYLRGLDTPRAASSAAQQYGLGDALLVAQSLLESSARLWLVTRGAQAAGAEVSAPEQATLWGLGAAVAAERAAGACVRVDLDPTETPADGAAALFHVLSAADEEDLVAMRAGQRLAARLAPVHGTGPVGVGATRLATSSYGMLEGLHVEPMERRPPGPGEIEIEIAVTGLNFRDVLIALDMYPQRLATFGDECAGVVVRVGEGVDRLRVGDRVLAISQGSFATHITTFADLAFPVPDDLGLDAAATIPVPFLTAQYALVTLGHLRAGERVLIHAGAGGVGMAAIQVCQRRGAEVHATAGNPEKRAALRALGVEHVYDSRSLDFADELMAITGGEGVHAVLNSLAGEFIQRSVDVLAPGGRFLEIGRRDVWTAEHMAAERPDVEYHIVFLGDLSVGDPPAIQAMFAELMPRFAHGELTPLPLTVFDAGSVVDAFRFMAQARHTGKIVVRQPRAAVSSDGTYLITGGSGGIGLVVAAHLVELGVRSLALVGRSEPNARAAEVIDELRLLGADVRTFAADVAQRDQLASVLAEVDASMRPLRGVVHAAGVTADALLDDQTWEHFLAVLAPKVDGAQHLHDLTAGRDLDMFVMMSAASPVFGVSGQSNYVAANAFLDALASARRAAGLHGLSIGWGPWNRVGMTERVDDADLARLARRGMLALSVSDGLAAFDAALRAGDDGRAHVVAVALDLAALDRRPLLASLHGAAPAAPAAQLLQQWIDTVPGMRRSVITAFVDGHAKKVLGLSSRSDIPARQPFNEIGLDSLMAVELRNAIGVALGEPQPATLLFDHPTSESLVDHLLGVVDARSGGPAAKPAADHDPDANAQRAADDLALLTELSEDEAEAMLLAELGSLDGDS